MSAILVTGGAGYIGSHVVLAARDAGREVIVVDDLSTGHAVAVPRGVPLYVGSCADPILLGRIWRTHEIGAVIHLAARTVVPDSIADPLGYYAANTCASRALLSRCLEGGMGAFVFSSTAAVYGVPDAPLVDEEAPCRPVSPYGRSKLMTEHMIADAAAAGALPHAVLRYFNVAGADAAGRAGQRGRGATHLLKRVGEVAAGLRPHLEIYGTDYDTPDGTAIRDFVHVSDLARAHLAVLDHLLGGGESATLNCGTGRGVSVREAAEAAGRLIGRPLPTRELPRRPGDVPAIAADAGRIARRLGWRPRESGIDRILSSAMRFEMSRAERRAA